MAAPRITRHYTPEEYLAYERQALYKNEYIAGQIIAMSGASEEHNIITGNIFWVLKSQLRGRSCRIYMSDMRVKVSTQGMYTYPDVTVVCGQPQFEDRQVDTLLNPTLIVEVLSPSTQEYDRGAKFGYYQTLPSLQEYVLVAQDKARVEHYVRFPDTWVCTAITDLASAVQIPSIDCTVPMDEIYDQIVFPPSAAAAKTDSPGEAGDQPAT